MAHGSPTTANIPWHLGTPHNPRTRGHGLEGGYKLPCSRINYIKPFQEDISGENALPFSYAFCYK